MPTYVPIYLRMYNTLEAAIYKLQILISNPLRHTMQGFILNFSMGTGSFLLALLVSITFRSNLSKTSSRFTEMLPVSGVIDFLVRRIVLWSHGQGLSHTCTNPDSISVHEEDSRVNLQLDASHHPGLIMAAARIQQKRDPHAR